MVETIRHGRADEFDDRRLRRARTAVTVPFVVNGMVFASWISRVPALRDAFDLTGAQLGMLLLCLSAGAVAALPAAGPVVHRFGAARIVAAGSAVVAMGLWGVGAGILLDAVALSGASLIVVGVGMGAWDVAMNVEGTEVERGIGRTILPRLHGWFSVGSVLGAGVGALAAWTGVPLAAQVLVAGPLGLVAVALAARWFFPQVPAARRAGARPSSGVGRAWREPRTLLVGLLTLGFAFTEGSANDWLAVALVDGFDASEAVGAAGFAGFVAAMTVGRMVGGGLVERWGRVPVLRASALAAVAGLTLVLVGGDLVIALVGSVLWGLGAALGFPAGISAAADDPAMAAARVSVVSAIAYTAFLAGPPVVGPLSDAVGMPAALVVVVAALGLSLATAGAARRPRGCLESRS
ncbi:MAG: MFS transporter [Kineosporiaceae bacterium]